MSLQWGRVAKDAETATGNPIGLLLSCFNGAASRRTRKPVDSLLVRPAIAKLQWGRVAKDAETMSR